MREELLADWPGPGVLLGSELDLLARYETSRPTLRQAIRILEMEGLVLVRRGKSGGFFTSLPNSDGAARAAGTYLRSRHPTPLQLISGSIGVTRLIAAHAAQHPSAAARRELLQFVESYQSRPRDDEQTWMPDVDREWARRIHELVDNPVLSLFWTIAGQVWGGDRMAPTYDAKRYGVMRRYHRVIAEAVAEGDAETAAAGYGEFAMKTARWIEADERAARR